MSTDIDLRRSGQSVAHAGADDEAAIPVSIVPLHVAVEGRARLKVGGFRHAPAMRPLIERGLAAFEPVRSVSANPLTGNVLVHYDATVPLDAVIARLTALLRGEIAPPAADAGERDWHARGLDEVVQELGASLDRGLTTEEARRRLAAVGANVLPPPRERSDASILLAQFQSLPVGLLAGAAVLSVATGGLIEAGAILAVVALNGLIGFRTERGAERTIRSLANPTAPTAEVVRDGEPVDARADALAPGDLLLLSRGMVVPADARLVNASSLTVSEAALTGESLPVTKSSADLGREGAPLAERANMVYRGTIVTGGRGSAIVVETGARTQVGRIQALVEATAAPVTPIERQLGTLGEQLAWIALAASGVIFGVGWLRGLALLQLARSTLSVAVAAVPEGLPMVATTTLALGVTEMRRHGIHVRRLGAVEALAAVDVICFDKTGTLTYGSMSLAVAEIGGRILRSHGGRLDGALDGEARDQRLETLLSVASLCSETEIEDRDGARTLSGSATENALVQAAFDNGVDVPARRRAAPRLSVQHRTEAYRFMATSHAVDGGLLLAVKGSPDEVLARCVREALADGGTRLLGTARRAEIEQANAWMANQGLRVLGIAFRSLSAESVADGEDPPVENLTWIGLAGLADPVRPGLKPLMDRLHRAGIQTIMLTGDQCATARTIAGEAGLGPEDALQIVDAAGLEATPLAEIGQAAGRTHAFARISPGQKLRVVQSLQRAGRVVAMIGDGVNDAPALRAADVGFALGQDATGAARDVADVYIANDDPTSLLAAIERGRATYANIRKAIHYLVATNASEILLMLAGTAAGYAEPLAPLQLLWINLVSDVLPAIGLAMEPPEPHQMEAPPRSPDEPIIGRENLGRLGREAALLTASAGGAGLFAALRHGFRSPQVRTHMFASLVTAQVLHALTSRSATRGALERARANPALFRIVGGSLAVQAGALALPSTSRLLGSGSIGPVDGLAIAAAGVLPFLVGEVGKQGRGRPRRGPGQDRPAASAEVPPRTRGAAVVPFVRPGPAAPGR